MAFYQCKYRGQGTLEIIAIMTLVLAALLLFQKYIARAMMGRWKIAGDALGQEKIYSPTKTVECAYEFRFSSGIWYDVKCFESRDSSGDCSTACFAPVNFGADKNKCLNRCIKPCQETQCLDGWGGT